MIRVLGVNFEVIQEEREAWDEEAFKARYSDVLNKYDYIVGDWGYSQLRLRGFFDDSNRKATYDSKISTLPEYLFEYCNFGCPYFVLRRVKEERGNAKKVKDPDNQELIHE